MAYKNNYEDLLREIQSSGQNWSSADMALAQENPDAGRSIFTQKAGYATATTDEERQAYNRAAEMIREKNGGYTGGKTGSGFTLSDKYAPAVPDYVKQADKYTAQIDSLFSQLKDRGAFTYNPSADPSYQAYSEKYRNLGRNAAADALGSAAAMTGGQLNSYALTASQQAQDAYNSRMSDVIPELQQLAYQKYSDELGQKRADLSTLQGMQQNEYGMIRDAHQDSVTNWQLNQGAGQQALENSRYDDETAWDRGTYASETARKQAEQKAQTLASAGNFSGYKALGYSDAEISLLKTAYDREMAAAQAKAATNSSRGGSSGSSGGGSGGGSGEPDYEGLYAAAQKSANPDNYIATNYKKYGFTKLTGLSGGYKDWVKGQEEPSKAINGVKTEVGNMFYNWGRQGLSNDAMLDRLDTYLAAAQKNGRITEADSRALVQYVAGLMKLK